MQLPTGQAGWAPIAKPDRYVERTIAPVIFNLSQAVDWIKQEKPIIWLGSIFSVPEPSGLPSGSALTQSLFNMILADALPKDQLDKLISRLASQWPLEALLDEFEFFGFDLSSSLLEYFKDANDKATPNLLHQAVAAYYKDSLAAKPLCITSNWDTLQEEAFRQAGFTTVISAGPGSYPESDFGEVADNPLQIFLYHPHGSFESKDVVCSYKREQRPLSLPVWQLMHPTIYLGYSGYEPSLYSTLLELPQGQLWCIRDSSDLQIPAKRRLLCRSNTFVYVGDLQELLRALGVLQEEVSPKTKYLHFTGTVPNSVVADIQLGIAASVDIGICVSNLSNVLLSFPERPGNHLRYLTLMRALIGHMRNRMQHPAIPLTLMAAARFIDSEQKWISLLAYQLREQHHLSTQITQWLLDESNKAYEEEKAHIARSKKNDADASKTIPTLASEELAVSAEDAQIYGLASSIARRKIYRFYVGYGNEFIPEPIFGDDFLYHLPSLTDGDLAGHGELLEVLAFEYLRQNEVETAKNVFDNAATSFYLTGLWNAGQANEWAVNNIIELAKLSGQTSLMIPQAS